MRALPAVLGLLVVGALLGSMATIAMTEQEETSRLTKFTSEFALQTFVRGHGGSSGESKATAEGANDASYSGTNVQVQGVDEGDRVKTDGTHIFIADAGRVHVIAAGLPMTNVSEIVISSNGSAYIQGLYLESSRLVVICSEYDRVTGGKEGPAAMSEMYYPYYEAQQTSVRVYNVSDPSAPVLERTAGLSGYLVTSRMIGSTLYLVTDHSVWTYSGSDVRFPEIAVDGSSESVAATDVSYDPAMPEVSSFVNLMAYDTSSGRVGTLSTLAGPTSVVYMSPTALYLTMQLWKSGDVSSNTELTTSIYRVVVNGTELTLGGQGSVDGRPLNQFALDESGDRLRIATTTGWFTSSSNEVHVLDLEMKKVGELTGIAPGESIYSCRFMGDRLYLVTYLQIDPLFIVDLSADTPRVLGELKVPGASNYLQMVDAGLMGIGFDNGAVKVSLFNVTDPLDLREIDSFVVQGFSYSPAQYDHKAVLYVPGTGTLVIPVTYYGSGYWTDTMTYQRPASAALVLKLDGEGMSELGRIVHENATVDRSLYIGEVLYTISDTTIRASSLGDLEDLGSLVYGDGRYYYGTGDGIAVPL